MKQTIPINKAKRSGGVFWQNQSRNNLITMGLMTFILIIVLRYRDNNLNFSLTNHANLQILPAKEFVPMNAIAVSENLFGENTGGLQLANEIMAAGSRLLILSEETMSPDKIESWLSEIGFAPENFDAIDVINFQHDSFWIRDFGPHALVLGTKDNPQDIAFANFNFRDTESLNDTLPFQIGLYLNKSIISIPVTMDGGNFMTNGQDCILTNSIEWNDKKSPIDPFKIYMGCNNVYTLESLPHPHIDMWAKFLNDEVLLINDLEMDSLTADALGETNRTDSQRAQNSLNKSAQLLAKNFKIERIPMPPILDGVFRTYTNSLLVNGTAIIPSYENAYLTKEAFPDLPQIKKIEEKVAAIYTKYGYKVRFINSDFLISSGGSFHCVTFNIPQFKPGPPRDTSINAVDRIESQL